MSGESVVRAGASEYLSPGYVFSVQTAANLIAALLGARAPPPPVVFRKSGGDEPGAVLLVVEAYYPVVESDGHIRDREIVVTRPRQAFQIMAQIISEQPGGTALERRQTRNAGGAEA